MQNPNCVDRMGDIIYIFYTGKIIFIIGFL